MWVDSTDRKHGTQSSSSGKEWGTYSNCVFDTSGILQEFAGKEFIKQGALKYFGLIYDVNMVSLPLFHFQHICKYQSRIFNVFKCTELHYHSMILSLAWSQYTEISLHHYHQSPTLMITNTITHACWPSSINCKLPTQLKATFSHNHHK